MKSYGLIGGIIMCRRLVIVSAAFLAASTMSGCVTTDNASAPADNPYPTNYKELIKANKEDIFIDPDSVRDPTAQVWKICRRPVSIAIARREPARALSGPVRSAKPIFPTDHPVRGPTHTHKPVVFDLGQNLSV